MTAETKAQVWMQLALTPGLGLKRLEALKSLNAPLTADNWQAFSAKHALSSSLHSCVEHAFSPEGFARVKSLYEWEAQSPLHKVLLPSDPLWPAELNEIHCSPAYLLFEGDTSILSSRKIAMVGARQALPACEQLAYSCAQRLARSSITVVSGLARGIDAQAHKGTLAGGGRTLAVLPAGPDVCYPAEHRALRAKIVESGGGVLYEHPVGTALHKGMFPQRNRLVIGLSEATLLIQAGNKSGTMVSARLALEANRDLWVAPMPFWMAEGEGSNRLIQEGAQVLLSPDDLKNAFDLPDISLNGLQGLLGQAQGCPDQLSLLSGKPFQQVMSELMQMEIQGQVKRVPGGRYVAI